MLRDTNKFLHIICADFQNDSLEKYRQYWDTIKKSGDTFPTRFIINGNAHFMSLGDRDNNSGHRPFKNFVVEVVQFNEGNDNITHIGIATFYQTKIRSLILPGSVKYMGEQAVYDNQHLEFVDLSKTKIVTLEHRGIVCNAQLHTVNLPSSLRSSIRKASLGVE